MASNGVEVGGIGLGPERMADIQRSRILAAMVEVSSERGAANVTVAHIVDRAGVSRRTFYELYNDREECFLATFDEAAARATRYTLEQCELDAGWAIRARTGLRALLCFLDSDRGVARLLIVGSLGAGATVLERRGQVLEPLVAFVDSGRRESEGDAMPLLTAEGIVGGILAVLHARLLADEYKSLAELANPLMAMIVLPYLGTAAARRELRQAAPEPIVSPAPIPADPLRDVGMRLTYRTVRVLAAVAELGGKGSPPSNREIGEAAGMQDQGQISKLLTRLHRLGLIENSGEGLARGAPNAWVLTAKGREIERAVTDSA